MMSAAWPSFTAAWYSPSAATILARRSRSASASLAMARCMFSGSTMSLISTAVHQGAPGLGMPIDDVLDLQVDARGVGQQLVKAESSDHVAHGGLADLIDCVIDV